MSGWTEEEVLARGRQYLDEQARERKRGLIQPTPIVQHVFVAVGGDFPLTCKQCACYKDSVNHFPMRVGRITMRMGRIKGVALATDRTYDGRVYHSKAEMMAAMQLDFSLKAGLIRRWTPQVPYPIIVNGERVCKVVVDFEVENLDGSIEAVEIKGFSTELFKLKAKLLKACYPALKYRVVAV